SGMLQRVEFTACEFRHVGGHKRQCRRGGTRAHHPRPASINGGPSRLVPGSRPKAGRRSEHMNQVSFNSPEHYLAPFAGNNGWIAPVAACTPLLKFRTTCFFRPQSRLPRLSTLSPRPARLGARTAFVSC